MIRVLHVFNIMNRGGAETMIMNYYRHIDRTKIQFDFIVHRQEEGAYDEEIEALGGKIYRLPEFNPLKIIQYKQAIRSVLNENEQYHIIHAHNCTTNMYELREAKKKNIPVRIAHSHLARREFDFKTPFFTYNNLRINEFCTHKFACSKDAGKWHFRKKNKNLVIMNNAIDVEKYRFNKEIREQYREELGIRDKFVVGHVGRYNKSKNHSFIIEVFMQMLEENKLATLVLVGAKDGEYEKIKKIIKENNIEENVILTGMREDVHNLLQAFDAFIFPSIFEALPVTLIEAQATGLPCYVSDSITRDIAVTELVKFISLKQPPKEWASKILNDKRIKREDKSIDIVENQYDIKQNSRWLEEFYTNL